MQNSRNSGQKDGSNMKTIRILVKEKSTGLVVSIPDNLYFYNKDKYILLTKSTPLFTTYDANKIKEGAVQ